MPYQFTVTTENSTGDLVVVEPMQFIKEMPVFNSSTIDYGSVTVKTFRSDDSGIIFALRETMEKLQAKQLESKACKL